MYVYTVYRYICVNIYVYTNIYDIYIYIHIYIYSKENERSKGFTKYWRDKRGGGLITVG